jgi:hypothetical protein
MTYYIVNVMKSRFGYLMAELRDENDRLEISANLEYILEQVSRRGWKLKDRKFK